MIFVPSETAITLDREFRRKCGQAIRDRRVELGLSLEDVAGRMTDVGHPISRAAIGMWERGETAPRLRHQLSVAAVLGVRPSDLFRLDHEPEIEQAG